MTEILRSRPYAGLTALPECYARVFEAGSRHSFFLTLDWFCNLAEHTLSDKGELQIYGVERENGNPVAALPLVRLPRTSLLSPNTLEGLSNYYTSSFAPIVQDGQSVEDAAEALAAGLWRDRRQWDVINLKPIARDAPSYDALVGAFRSSGMVVQTYFCFGNWYLEVAGRSYRQYVGDLSSVLRRNIPYNIRRLEKGENNRFVILTDGTELESALDDYERVYSASWKGQEAKPEFIRSLARLAAKNGWLRLGLVYVGGEPAAAQLWIVHAGIASIYKIVYDERFAKLSAGTALTAKVMEHVIEVDKVSVVDYLSGEDDYKKNWMSHRREFWGILALNPRTVRGLVQVARHIGADVGKKALRRLAGSRVLGKLGRHEKGSFPGQKPPSAG